MRNPYSATMGASTGFGDAYEPQDWERQAITPSDMKPYLTPSAGGTMGSVSGGGWSDAFGGGNLGLLAGGLASDISNLFGHGDDYSGPDPAALLKKIPGAILPIMKPYMGLGKMGMEALTGGTGQIGAGYQQSPGLHFAIQQALQGAGHAAGAGGMAGSPLAQQQAEQTATGLAQQDYYNWMRNMMGITGMGQQASRSVADDIAQALAGRAAAAYAQEARAAQSAGDEGSGIGGLLGTLLGGVGGFVLGGGPAGAVAGAEAGGSLGREL